MSQPYGTWPSPIGAEALAAGARSLSELKATNRAVYWLEARPDESGRTTLLRWTPDGSISELTPEPFNVRSRVHEYGGGAFAVETIGDDDRVVFVNASDQNVYQIADGTPTQLTRSDDRVRYADLDIGVGSGRCYAIVEDHNSKPEPANGVVAIESDGSVLTLARGHDFYAAPRIARDERALLFLSWDHPNMPWDGTQLHRLELDRDSKPISDTILAGGADVSICEPAWAPGEIGAADRVTFASDESGYWNLYALDESGQHVLFDDRAEYAGPAWTFGTRHAVAVDGRRMFCQRQDHGAAELCIIDTSQQMCTPADDGWVRYDYVDVFDGWVYFVASATDRSQSIVRRRFDGSETDIVYGPRTPAIDPGYRSEAEHVSFPTSDGAAAYAYFYAPRNSDCTPPNGELPPLLVMAHGGPTAATTSALNPRIQFYTSRGWAVVDVDYRGSSGYGRAYRDALAGQWGNLDVQDCVDAARHLIAQGRVDARRVAIRGGSAGGYTTLRALTTATLFAAGASWYGIGDLNALAADTHKFESRYLDKILGSPDALTERSPLYHSDLLGCPVIFLQGGQDRVVPPNQSETMVAALRRKKLPVAYCLYPDEAHGFRRAENIVHAARSEYTFFCRVLGIAEADPFPLMIENAP